MIQPLGMKMKTLILSSHCLSKFSCIVIVVLSQSERGRNSEWSLCLNIDIQTCKVSKALWCKTLSKKKSNKGGLQSLDILFEVEFYYVAKQIIFMQWVNTGNSTLAVRHHLPLSGADAGGWIGWLATPL